MSEQEQNTETEQAEDSPSTDTSQEQKKGTEFVDFKDPEIEARFKRIYGNMKQNERVISQLASDNKALIERLSKLENNQATTQVNQQVASLKEAKKKAFEAGDYDTAERLEEQLFELRAADKIRQFTQPKQPAKKDEPPAPALEPEDTQAIQSWVFEKNESGDLVRPWAHDGHPKYKRAASHLQAVFADDEFAGAPIKEVLAEVDRLMGQQAKKAPQRTASPVLSSDGNARPSAKSFKLTEEMKIVASKMGLTPEQYAKAVQKWS